MLEKTTKFINNICFEFVPPLIDDCFRTSCKGCGKIAWLRENIQHKKDCKIGQVIEEINLLRSRKENEGKNEKI